MKKAEKKKVMTYIKIYGNTCYKIVNYKLGIFNVWICSISVLGGLPIEHNTFLVFP